MASRDINVDATFWSNGVLIEKISKLTKTDTADKLNYKYGFLPTFAKNKNYGYSTDKENIESICPKKELYHVDLSKPIGIIIDGYLYGIEIDEEED